MRFKGRMCMDCAYFEALVVTASKGECRRHAPTAKTMKVTQDKGMVAEFPNVLVDDWCGEFLMDDKD